MVKKLKQRMMAGSAALFTGLVSVAGTAHAANVSTVTGNITTSIANVPGLLSGVSYMMGVVFGVLGILKIKDHVENPGQTPLQQGAIRLAAGGALFALPFMFNVMQSTVVGTSTDGQLAVPGVAAIGTGLAAAAAAAP